VVFVFFCKGISKYLGHDVDIIPFLHEKMLKCLGRILEMRGSAGLYVTTNGTTSLEALGLVCKALVREILAALLLCILAKDCIRFRTDLFLLLRIASQVV